MLSGIPGSFSLHLSDAPTKKFPHMLISDKDVASFLEISQIPGSNCMKG